MDKIFRLRSALKEAIRGFFKARGYLEIDTPIVVPAPGTEIYLDYFPTRWDDFKGQGHELFLRSSPELHMKQALADGCPKIYQMAPCFRNGGEFAEWHHPEFTMLEWYEAGIGFEDFVQQTEDLLVTTIEAMALPLRALGITGLTVPPKMPRLSVYEAFERFAKIKLADKDEGLAAKAIAAGVNSVTKADDFETAFFKILIEKIEPGLVTLGPSVLWDYPPSQAALSRVEGGRAKRFEIYWNRVELCNGFFELLDPQENRRRIQEANCRRLQLGKVTPFEDTGFIAALDKGIPPSCGNALGFDRWLAILAGATSLDDVIPFRYGSFKI
jgi:elongation factor P--(R)-beta-lysine ligase